MKISPLRTFFYLAIISALLSYMFDLARTKYLTSATSLSRNSPELAVARYYAETGQFEKAVEEYKSLRESNDLYIKNLAMDELSKLINLQDNGWLFFRQVYLTNVLWILSQKLYITSFIFFVTWLVFLISALIWKKPELSIQPIIDHSGQNIGDDIAKLATNRSRSIIYNLEKLNKNPMIISEALEVPVITMMAEGNLADIMNILETSLILSNESIKNLPLSSIFQSIRIWLEQPRYLLRSYLGKSNNSLVLTLSLVKTKSYAIVKEWKIKIEPDINSDITKDVVDALIFPIIFYLGGKVETKRWEAFKELQRGLDEFVAYEEMGFESSNLQNASNYMEKALVADQNYDIARYNLALLLLQVGDYERAKDLFKITSDSSINSKTRQYSLYGYSVALLHINQIWTLERAAEILKHLIEDSSNREFLGLSTSTLAMVYSRLAETKNNKETYTNLALAEVQKVKVLHIDNKTIVANALAAEGYSFLVLDAFQKANASFQEALKLDPKSVGSVIGLGLLHIKNGEKEKAIGLFQKAEKLSPSGSYISYKLGNIYREIGDKENSVAAYMRAGTFSLAHLMLGKYYLDDQRYNDALIEFRIAVSLNKKLGEAWQNIAWTICESETKENNLLKEAEDAARKALELEKDERQRWHRQITVSRVLLIRGKTQEALTSAKKSVALAPKRAQAHYYLALAQYTNNFRDESQSHAKLAIELDEENGEWQSKANELLSQLHNK